MSNIENNFKLFESKITNYKKRDEQIRISESIYNSINNENHSIIEAGTGIGKSYAYIVALIQKVKDSKKDDLGYRAVISTETKNLQNQIYKKDLKNALDILEANDIKTALAIGFENFICLKKYNNVKLELSKNKEVEKCINDNGNLLDLDDKLPVDIINNITINKSNCTKTRCSFYGKCFYFQNEGKVIKADIIVTNHTMLIYDSVGKNSLLGAYNTAIVDEAHGLIDVARKCLSVNIHKDYSKLMLEYGNELDILGEVEILELVSNFTSYHDENFKVFEKILNKSQTDDFYLITEKDIPDIHNNIKLGPTLQELIILDKQLNSISRGVDDYSEDTFILINKINTIFNQLLEFYSFLRDLNLNIYVFHIENKENAVIKITPIDVSYKLKKIDFFDRNTHCLSATLGFFNGVVNPNEDKDVVIRKYLKTFYNDFMDKEISINDINMTVAKSPFNYKDNVKLYIPDTLLDYVVKPYGKNNDFTEYNLYVKNMCNEIEKLYNVYNGSILVLFTSNSLMNDVHYRLKNNYTIFTQSEYGVDVAIKNFKENNNSMLFGVNSMWQGVDIQGSQLRCVAITKLMFKHVNDPIAKGIEYSCQKNGGNPFYDIQVPYCGRNLKQAFGRLIRTEDDYGIVAVLDNSMNTKKYSNILKINLPVKVSVNEL